MPPVNTSASPSDVDNEATAELPVLDVAAYESDAERSHRAHRYLDSADGRADCRPASATVKPRREMPAISPAQAGLRRIDHSGTHEMPQRWRCRRPGPRRKARQDPRRFPRLRLRRHLRPTPAAHVASDAGRRSSCRHRRRSSKSCATHWRPPSGASKNSTNARASPMRNAAWRWRVPTPRPRSCASS